MQRGENTRVRSIILRYLMLICQMRREKRMQQAIEIATQHATKLQLKGSIESED
jgi:hypothetical protein